MSADEAGNEAGGRPGHDPTAHPHDPALGADPDASRALEEFRHFRERMNGEILAENNLVINRFFNLDGRAYEAGALDVRTKELLGLVASLVLRCDDCVTYHLVRCAEVGISREEMFEACSIGLVVGGSIVIPHQRRAVNRWTELERAGRGQAP